MGLTIIDTLSDGTQKAQITDASGNVAELKDVAGEKALKIAVIETVSQAQISSTATLSSVASSITSAVALASNPNRKGVSLFNDSTKIAYVAFAATASASAFTIKLPAGALYEKDYPIYTGVISVIWAAAQGFLRVTELT